MKRTHRCRHVFVVAVLAAFALVAMPAFGQDACEGFDCDNLPDSICDPGGFAVSLIDFVAANDPNNFTGNAIYTYEICSPDEGVCTGDGTTPCLDNEKCTKGGNPPGGTCMRECAVDSFRDLSHFNIDFPDIGGAESCIGEGTMITGSCACSAGSSAGCSVGDFVLSDGSCGFEEGTVAKCDETNMNPGDCIEMELNIPGENNLPGLGTAIVVSKEAQDCNESCLAGPSCDPCDTPPATGVDDCLTRTLGFWGTHPWVTNDYAPVTVCGYEVGCFGLDDGMSDPSCPASSCDSIMEALGSNGGELKGGSAYISLIRQLAAAKLNLNATFDLSGESCPAFEYEGKNIQTWIALCENLCDFNQSVISGSGCIEALDAFNNSEDTFGITPAPFDRPPLDDAGNISGADPSGFTGAKNSGYVIGKKTTGPDGQDCR